MHILIIGGSSGMGLALAGAALAEGAEVTIAGRDSDRLAKAAAGLGSPAALRTIAADVSVESEVDRVITATGPLDHVVTTAADPRGAYAPITEFDAEAAR